MKLNLQVILGMLLAVVSCSPTGPAQPATGQQNNEDQPTTTRTLTLAIQREPTEGFIGFSGGSRRGGANNAQDIVHNRLVIGDENGAIEPQLVTELISVDNGTGRINPDGSMDTIWRLRPNVTWHDGTPFTAEDLLFGFTVKKDPAIPWRSSGPAELMESARAIDAHTFAVHWISPYFGANTAPDLTPMPKHLLGTAYLADRGNFLSHPGHSTEFVGLGPYRLQFWQAGSHMELVRYDGYYSGRPFFDRVVLRFLSDPNTMVANILSGDVDVLVPLGVDVEAAVEVRQRWENTGNQVRFILTDLLWLIDIQHRPEYARPTDGLTNRLVRAGLYQAIDRQTLSDIVTHNLAPLADSWITPNDPLRRDVASAIPQFPHDPARAQQLLVEAGWVRRADGALAHAQTGERFEVELRGYQAGGIEKQLGIVADGWKATGAAVSLNVVPVALQVDLEYAAKNPGAIVQFLGGPSYMENRLHSRGIAGPANRWTGRNRLGYSNPTVDGLLESLVVTIAPGERVALHRQLLQAQMGDVPMMPLYWEVSPVLMVQGVAGPLGGGGDVLTKIAAWRKS